MKDAPDMLDYATPRRPDGPSRVAVVAAGLVVGTALWLWLFGLVFTGSYADEAEVWGVRVVPLVLIAFAAAVLAAMAPRQWLWGAAAVAGPTTLFGMTCFSAAIGRGSAWEYLRLAAVVAGCSFVAALLARGRAA